MMRMPRLAAQPNSGKGRPPPPAKTLERTLSQISPPQEFRPLRVACVPGTRHNLRPATGKLPSRKVISADKSEEPDMFFERESHTNSDKSEPTAVAQ
jgi:hypothetical protein